MFLIAEMQLQEEFQDKFFKMGDQIDYWLAERSKVYPSRKHESFLKSKEHIESFTEFLLNYLYKYNWQDPDKVLLQNSLSFRENPVFICGSMKSGTSLLVQLLDGHEQLMVMPGDSLYYNKFFSKDLSFDTVARYWIPRMITPTGLEPFWFLPKKPEVFIKFLSCLNYLIRHVEDAFFSVVMAAYMSGSAADSAVRYWVEKTPHNEKAALKLSAHYPEAKFIHIVRDPIQNLASIKKMRILKREKFILHNHLFTWINLVHQGFKNQKEIGENKYLIIRYEDLVNEPEQQMNKVADFLQVPYSDLLLKPTQDKIPATANSVYVKNRVKGIISDQSLSKGRRNEFSTNEIKEIVTYTYPIALKLGYSYWHDPEIFIYKKRRMPFKPFLFNLKMKISGLVKSLRD